MVGDGDRGSTNAVDQLLRHTDGPINGVDRADFDRLRYSKQIVDINYTRLDGMCEDMATDGFIYVDSSQSYNDDEVKINIYANIHNYLSSLYSFVEELHQFIDSCVSDDVDKATFVRGSDSADPSLPQFVQKLAFAWGLRNQFTHGNYRCLSITKRNVDNRDYFQVQFHKTQFDPRGRGELKEVGDYLWGVTQNEETYPMCYFASLHNYFLEFWNDTGAWCSRADT